MSADPAELEAWGGAWNGGLIMIEIADKFVIVDIDNKNGKDGDADLAALVAEHDALPMTPQWRTPSGGRQILFAVPAGVKIKRSISSIGVRLGETASGLDILAGRSLTVLPGSIRPNGPVEWLPGLSVDEVPLASLPTWLLELIREPEPTSATGKPRHQQAALTAQEAVNDMLASMAPAAARDHWQGTKPELDYLVDALQALDRAMVEIRAGRREPVSKHRIGIDIRRYQFWSRVGMALHWYFGGSTKGLNLWIAVTAGDASLGLAGCPECFDEAEMRADYASFGPHPKPARIGTIFDFAIAIGFNAKRSRFGLKPLPAPASVLSEGGRAVEAAGREFKRLCLVDGRDLRYEAVSAVLLRANVVAFDAGLATAARAVLDVVVQLVNNDKGFAWCGHVWLAQRLSELARAPYSPKGIKKALGELKKKGLLVVSDADKIGANGLKGPTYALLPSSEGWMADIEWRRTFLGHAADDAAHVNPFVEAVGQSEMKGVHQATEAPPHPEPLRDIPTPISGEGLTLKTQATPNPGYSTNSTYYDDVGGGEMVGGVVDTPGTAGHRQGTSTEVPLSTNHVELLAQGVLPEELERAFSECRSDAVVDALVDRCRLALTSGLPAYRIRDHVQRASWSAGKHLQPAQVLKRAGDAVVRLIGDIPANRAALAEVLQRDEARSRHKQATRLQQGTSDDSSDCPF